MFLKSIDVFIFCDVLYKNLKNVLFCGIMVKSKFCNGGNRDEDIDKRKICFKSNDRFGNK